MTRREWLAGSAAITMTAAQIPSVKALVFDVFGTVVDWRSSIIRDGEHLGRRKGLRVDWARFADDWRDGYGPAMDRVRKGELGWTKIDDLHRMILDGLVEKYKLPLTEAERAEFNRVWHRLTPWPDSVAGLTRLKKRYLIATLSNGNTSLLAHMAKFGGLPWDVVLSAEMARHYKPDREAYLMAAEYLSVAPGELLMVAAHKSDLHAARKAGLKTAFVPRPLERGPGRPYDAKPDPEFDLVAADFLELAGKLGA